MEVATRCWLEIDLAAIEENARAITKRAGPERTWLAVVKADGYGHGAVPAAERALAGGADQLAVAALEEALALRAAGIRREILVLGYCPAEYAPTAGEAGIALTAFDLTTIAAYEAAMPAGKRLRVHLKVDTGMGRMGVLANEAGVAIQALRESERLAATVSTPILRAPPRMTISPRGKSRFLNGYWRKQPRWVFRSLTSTRQIRRAV